MSAIPPDVLYYLVAVLVGYALRHFFPKLPPVPQPPVPPIPVPQPDPAHPMLDKLLELLKQLLAERSAVAK